MSTVLLFVHILSITVADDSVSRVGKAMVGKKQFSVNLSMNSLVGVWVVDFSRSMLNTLSNEHSGCIETSDQYPHT